MGKGSNTTQQTKTFTPAAMGAYQSVLDRAGAVASTPYQAYGGQLTAGINPYQEQAFGAINQAAGFASPYINEAAGLGRGAAAPIGSGDIDRYMDPYAQRVVDATQAQFNEQNARAQSGLVGNAAAKGALGGDRVSVAQSTLAGEHARAQNPVIAGLYSQGYQGALGAAERERARQAQAAGQLAGFGTAGAQAGLAGGMAQLQAGSLQQQTEQQRLSALYGQYQLAQAFPYQQAQWLAGITTGVGSQMGGTTTGEMTKPPPDPWATAGGLGLGAAGMFLSDSRAKDDIEQIGTSNDGLPIYRFKYSGDPSGKTQIGLMAQDVEKVHPEAVAEFGGMKHIDPEAATDAAARRGFAAGGVPGMPWGGVQGFIPEYKITPGKTEPDLDKWPTEDKATDFSKYGQLGAQIGQKAWGQLGSLSSISSPGQDYSLTSTGGMWARGGGVWMPGGYAEGGDVPWALDDRFSAAFPNATKGIPPALDDAVKGFADRYPALTAFAPGGSDPEAMRGGLQELGAERERALRAQALSKPVPTYSAPVPEEPVPPPPARSLVAGVAPPEEPVPVAARPAPGRPPMMAPEEPYYRAPGLVPAPMEGPSERRRGFGLLGKLDPAVGQGLMAAGFGMMASRSPHLGVAIGEGGLTGMSAYAGVKAGERDTEEKRLTRAEQSKRLDLEAEKLDETARHHRATLAETTRHRKADEMKPIVIHRTRDKYGNVLSETLGVRDPSGGYRVINPDGTLSTQVIQPGQTPAPIPAPTGTPNTTAAPRIASEEEQGAIPRNAMLVSSGPYDYSTGAPSLEKGFDVPEPQQAGDMSPAEVRRGAERFLIDGTQPKLPYGKSPIAGAQRAYAVAVTNYANALAQSRGISPAQLAELQRDSKGYLRFVLGADGRSTVALGTAVRHLDTMQQLADAWKANDIRAINALRSVLSRQFGGNAATDLQTAATIVGPEIIKAIGVAGAGTHAERLAQESFLSPNVSPDQMAGSIKTLQKLLGGQLDGKRRQAGLSGVSEEKLKALIGDRPYEILSTAEKPHGGGGGAGSGGDGTKENPIGVKSKAEMEALKPGTWYRTPSGKAFQR